MMPFDRRHRILVADRDAHTSDILGAVLAHEGYLVKTVSSEEQALATAVEAPPDLLVIEAAMNGFDVCSALRGREETKDVAVVFIADEAGERSLTKARLRGACAYLCKPLRLPVVVELVRTVLERRLRTG